MKEFLKRNIEKILPIKYQLPFRYFYLQKSHKLDQEMFYVLNLLKSKRRFLDIGANVGIYSFHFRNIFKNIDAFEPLNEISYRLHHFQNEFLKVHDVALSNKSGELQLYIPYRNEKPIASLASLEKKYCKCEVRTVEVNTLDNYDFDDVDLIKIDVEGHEQSVIEGANKVIKKNMPLLIIEIEHRHIKNNIEEVFQSVLDLNYFGFFLKNNQLTPLDKFNYELNQKQYLNDVMVKDYINNFIFIPRLY